jgi:hypothetical protein
MPKKSSSSICSKCLKLMYRRQLGDDFDYSMND